MTANRARMPEESADDELVSGNGTLPVFRDRRKASLSAACRPLVRRLIAPIWHWCSFADGAPPGPLPGLYSAEHFWRALRRERGRTDRSGLPFSLLTFTPRDVLAAPATLLALSQILADRLRFTDEAGWLDDWQIGVILPGTGAAGAWKVADDVVGAFSTDQLPPLCKVYVYPNSGRLEEESFPSTAEDLLEGDRQSESLEPLLAQGLPPWKRAIDVAGALIGIVLLWPLLAAVALLVRLTSPGPVVFRQWRSGLGGRQFQILKFRTMTVDAEQRKQELLALNQQDGPAFKIPRDPRTTPIGRILRSTSIDELPQLWNVLKGEMSLVGPRPLPVDEQSRARLWHARRLEVTPGLTCIWQVEGRSRVTFEQWMRMDLKYVQRSSLVLDLKLLLATIPSVLLQRGAH